jgi:hypothetical protein
LSQQQPTEIPKKLAAIDSNLLYREAELTSSVAFISTPSRSACMMMARGFSYFDISTAPPKKLGRVNLPKTGQHRNVAEF